MVNTFAKLLRVEDDLRKRAGRLAYIPGDSSQENAHKRGALCWWGRRLGLQFYEIARILQCSESTAHRQFHRFNRVAPPDASPAEALRAYEKFLAAGVRNRVARRADKKDEDFAVKSGNLRALAEAVANLVPDVPARRAAICYWANYRMGMSQAEVARVFERSPTDVSRHILEVRDCIRAGLVKIMPAGSPALIVADLAEQMRPT